MKNELYKLILGIIGIAAICFICAHSKADCVFVWKPGDTSAVVAGHDVHFIVEAEDVDAYQHQKKLDAAFLNLPPMTSDFDDALDKLAHVHHCGDYKEVQDIDFE